MKNIIYLIFVTFLAPNSEEFALESHLDATDICTLEHETTSESAKTIFLNFNTSNSNTAIVSCMDGIQNGDETGVDCGGATCPECGLLCDGFDYPIGDRGRDNNGYPYEVPENIAPECNNIYSNAPQGNPNRGGGNLSYDWANVNDVGNFLDATGAKGIHPGEDWNYHSGEADAGEEVYAVGHGVVEEISPTDASYLTGGWTIIIKHTLPNGNIIRSIYTHMTSANEPDGNLSNSKNDFTVMEGHPVYRGNLIARIAKGKNSANGPKMTEMPFAHLHFELRDERVNISNIYARDNGNGYYGGTYCSSTCSTSGVHNTMTSAQVSNAFLNMKKDGILEASDYIDINRAGQINQNLDIYAGSTSSPKDFYVEFHFPHSDFNISGIKLSGDGNTYNMSYNGMVNIQPGIHGMTIEFPGTPSALSDCKKYDLEFTLTSTTSMTDFKFYGEDQVYFLGESCVKYCSTSGDCTNHYSKPFMKFAWKSGYLRGGAYGSNDIGFLDTNGDLSKGEASKILFNLAKTWDIVTAIDVDISSQSYDDLNYCDWYFPYAQTLLNAGFNLSSNADNNFYGDDPITNGEFFTWISTIFNTIENCSDPDFNCQASTNFTCNNSTWNTAIESFENTYIIINDKAVSMGKLTKFGSNSNCYDVINRGDASRLITGIHLYYYQSNTSSLKSDKSTETRSNIAAPVNLDGWNVIGSNAISDYSSNLAPLPPSSYTINLDAGELWTSNAGPLQDDFGNDLQYYWSIQGGELNSLLPENNQVNWQSPMQGGEFTLNVWLGNSVGNYAEAEVTFIVSSSNNNSNYPDTQASNMYFNNILTNSIKANWTRGNGDKIIVTATPCGQNISPPVDGQDYNDDSDYSSAPQIGNSRIVYEGFASNVTVTGLAEGECYTFTGYEFNSVAGDTYYLLPNPVQGSTSTASGLVLDFDWDPINIVEDEDVDFDWISSLNGLSIEEWTFQGGNPPTDNGNGDGIVWNTPGQYLVTLNGYHATTMQWATVSKEITVLSLEEYSPDFVFQSATPSANQMVAGSDFEVDWSIINEGVSHGKVTLMNYYFSNDNILDGNDVQYPQMGNDYQGDILIGGELLSGSRDLDIPSSTAAGTVYIIIEIESGTPLSGLPELDFSNNTIAIPIEIVPTLPDLTMQNISISQNVVASGEEFDISTTFANIGNGFCCSYTYCVDYDIYLSEDDTWSEDDGDYYQGLGLNGASWCVTKTRIDQPGETYFHSRTISTQTWTPSGNYWLIVAFDTNNEEPELNENNNVFSIPITISNPNQPTVQATNLQITNTTSTSANLTWDSGNGQGRVVMAAGFGSNLFKRPEDGYDYSASSYWPSAGSWIDPETDEPYLPLRVVYEGTGDQVNVTGLDSNYTWYFSVYEYNLNNTQRDYLQANNETVYAHLGSSNVNYDVHYEEGNIYDLDFQARDLIQVGDTVLMFGSDGYFHRSTNNGLSFEAYKLSSSDIYFDAEISNNVIAAINYDGEIKVTTDYGDTWTLLPSPNPDNTYYSLLMLDDSTWLVGAKDNDLDLGLIYRTVNGGDSWGISNTQNERFYDFQKAGNSILAFGQNSTILKSYNDGLTWESLVTDLAPDQLLCQAIAINSNDIYMRTYTTLYKSTNGGTNWESILTSNSYGYSRENNLVVNDINSAYIMRYGGAEGGTVMETSNGGMSWQTKFQYQPTYSYGIVKGDNNSIWLIGTHAISFENCESIDLYVDNDYDGFGSGAIVHSSCIVGFGFSSNNLDCDDANALINPNSDEICDNIDNDCDNSIDEVPCNICTDFFNSTLFEESFDGDFGKWYELKDDSLDFTFSSATTPTPNTGPQSPYHGTEYIYLESSEEINGVKSANLISQCFDLASISSPQASLAYHMFGANTGSLVLEISNNDGMTWTDIMTITGNQGSSWIVETIDLSMYTEDQVMFKIKATLGNGELGDIAIDYFKVQKDPDCGVIIQNMQDTGVGSLRYLIGCNDQGGSLLFDPAISGQTIILQSPLDINKDYSLLNFSNEKMSIAGFNANKLFTVHSDNTFYLEKLKIYAPQSPLHGSAFLNMGSLILNDVEIFNHPLNQNGPLYNTGILHVRNNVSIK